MEGDVGLGNHNETGKTAAVLFVIAGKTDDIGSGYRMHLNLFRQFFQDSEAKLHIVKSFLVAVVSVYRKMLAESNRLQDFLLLFFLGNPIN